MSDKSMMFELWTECGSNCKFCYLGAKNQHTPDSEKLHNISKVSNIIKSSGMDSYCPGFLIYE